MSCKLFIRSSHLIRLRFDHRGRYDMVWVSLQLPFRTYRVSGGEAFCDMGGQCSVARSTWLQDGGALSLSLFFSPIKKNFSSIIWLLCSTMQIGKAVYMLGSFPLFFSLQKSKNCFPSIL